MGGVCVAVSKQPGVLIIVENLTVPLDRRVWQEARTLRDAGYTVSVVCPKGGQYTKSYEVMEDIHVFRHPMPYEADGALGYVLNSSVVWAAESTSEIYGSRGVLIENYGDGPSTALLPPHPIHLKYYDSENKDAGWQDLGLQAPAISWGV